MRLEAKVRKLPRGVYINHIAILDNVFAVDCRTALPW